MRSSMCHYSFGELLDELEKIPTTDRLFRIYGQSANLCELLCSLHNYLSDHEGDALNPEDISISDTGWENLLHKILSLCNLRPDDTHKSEFFYYLGNIDLLLDCIKSRDAKVGKSGLIRLFV
jgi:hypothetical protein